MEVWAALRSLGRKGLAEMIERNCRQAACFAEGLQAAGFAILNDVVLNQVVVSFGSDVQTRRGEPESAFAASPVRVDATYTTPIETHNPMEPSATVAEWRDGELTVHESTQWVRGTRAALAKSFAIDESRVRVIGLMPRGSVTRRPRVRAPAG